MQTLLQEDYIVSYVCADIPIHEHHENYFSVVFSKLDIIRTQTHSLMVALEIIEQMRLNGGKLYITGQLFAE